MPKIVICHFDYDGVEIYKKMCEVLIYSIRKNVTHSEIVTIMPPAPELNYIPKAFVTNTAKLQKWIMELNETEDNQRLIFMDADMLVQRDIIDIFDKDFDIAYTIREHSKFPINGGILFVKVNKRSREWMYQLGLTNFKMFNDEKFHSEWKFKYAGMNQSAMGYMIEKRLDICKTISLPCKEWNCCNESWGEFGESSRVLHIKGKFRRAIFGVDPIDQDIEKVVEIWRGYEREATEKKMGCNNIEAPTG